MDDGYDEISIATIQELIGSDDPELQDILIEAAHSRDFQLRVFASIKLAEIFHDIQSVATLAEAISQGDSSTRKAAVDAVWELGDANAAALLRALHFEQGDAREAIVEALLAAGWFPDDIESEVAFRIAVWAWRDIVVIGEAAVPALLSALDDPDGNVRRGAAWSLGQIGDPRAVPFLISSLSDVDGGLMGIGSRICDVAAESLLQIGTPDAIMAVEAWQTDSQS